MQWTDRVRQVKIILVLVAIVIAISSLVVSQLLTNDLKLQERKRMAVWAEAMRSFNKADENTDLNLVLKVLNENDYIPVIVLDGNGKVNDYRNVSLHAGNRTDSLREITVVGHKLYSKGRYIRIFLDNRSNDYVDVCYDESLILKRLAIYPYVQLCVVLIFVVIAIFALLTSKRAEQNKVWVGLSKETAHQLGTPISSLMAWIEVLKTQYPDDVLIPEMDKDVQRLQLISDRFSKVGSPPELSSTNLIPVLRHVADYMDARTSKSINIIMCAPDHDIFVMINSNLFEWVIENLCKNAVDAMNGGPGTITINVEELPSLVAIEVSDTGKGIRKKNLQTVFKPGFTTKKRGWGLGLSLAKRIIVEYHKGRIWVKSSVVDKGTTFRIELPS